MGTVGPLGDDSPGVSHQGPWVESRGDDLTSLLPGPRSGPRELGSQRRREVTPSSEGVNEDGGEDPVVLPSPFPVSLV